jgi:hypothetical protein
MGCASSEIEGSDLDGGDSYVHYRIDSMKYCRVVSMISYCWGGFGHIQVDIQVSKILREVQMLYRFPKFENAKPLG